MRHRWFVLFILGAVGAPLSVSAQGWDSVWVSLESSPPYSPTTLTQIAVGDTLFLRVGFSTTDTLSQFTLGLTYDTRKFSPIEIGFDVVDAVTGQPFDAWTFWSPTSFSQTCGIPIGDSLCIATWFGMTLMGSLFPLPPGQWMVGTLRLVATSPGPTVLVPAYLDTSTFKLPIPLLVEIQTSVAENTPKQDQKLRIVYQESQGVLKITGTRPSQVTLDLWDVTGRRIWQTRVRFSPPLLLLPLHSHFTGSSVYLLRLRTEQGETYLFKIWGTR